MIRSLILAVSLLCVACPGIAADPKKRHDAFLDAEQAGPDFVVQGEYEGKVGRESLLGAQVIALGDGKFDAVLFAKGLPGGAWDGKTKVPLKGETKDGATSFTGTNFKGAIKDGVFSGELDGVTFELSKVLRQSPTLGAKPPAGAKVLFDGSNVDAWVNGKLEDGQLLGVGTRTKDQFKDFTLHLEFRTPFMPTARGQQRGNSGMYLNDQYEFQVLDSFGLTGENNECGGYYKFAKPRLNMALPPLSWQTYDVDFTMARFDDAGKMIKPANATVRLNGVLIHEKYDIPKTNGGGGMSKPEDEMKPGSLFLQDHSDPVRYRNIWILEKPAS